MSDPTKSPLRATLTDVLGSAPQSDDLKPQKLVGWGHIGAGLIGAVLGVGALGISMWAARSWENGSSQAKAVDSAPAASIVVQAPVPVASAPAQPVSTSTVRFRPDAPAASGQPAAAPVAEAPAQTPDCAVRAIVPNEARVLDALKIKSSGVMVAFCSKDADKDGQPASTPVLRIIGIGETGDLTTASKKAFSALTRTAALAYAGVKNEAECAGEKPYTKLDSWNGMPSDLTKCQRADAAANYVEVFLAAQKGRHVADERYAGMYKDSYGAAARDLDRLGKTAFGTDELRQDIKAGKAKQLRAPEAK